MRHKYLYTAGLALAMGLLLMGFLLDDPRNILPGLWTILSSQDVLITDYIALAGPGAAFTNSALVVLCTLGLKWLVHEPQNGFDIVDLGLMAGFSLFGKNILNIWPIILGTWLFSRLKREPFGKFLSVALLATSLSPLVSFAGLTTGWDAPVLGLLLGVLVGFVAVPLSNYTYRIQNGMSLYNMGFACGLLAMVIVPLLTAMGRSPQKADYWATGYNLPLGIMLGVLCAILIASGVLVGGRRAAKSYWKLLHTTGRSPSDYLRMFGPGATLINMGVNGAISTAFILLTGGDLNGPTVGCIFTVIGFSAFGKHAHNILPIMAGVLLGSLVLRFSINDPAVQIALLLCTTLAPISGCFGWPYGVLAGFLHSAMVLEAGSVAEGINLYNNGFSGGLLAIVLYPIINSLVYHRRAMLQDKEYLDVFLDESPLSPEEEEKSHSKDVEMPF
ncbi:MAG: DUF1576 domain-containing protein [Oscillospiraceae bacterium]